VADGPSQPALRDLRRHLTAAPVLAALGGVTLVLAISGPFGTRDALGPGARALYWAAIVGPSYAAGAALSLALTPRMAGRPGAARIGGIGVLIGTLTHGLVAGANAVAFGAPFAGAAHWALRWAEIVAVALVVVGLRELLRHRSAPGSARGRAPGSGAGSPSQSASGSAPGPAPTPQRAPTRAEGAPLLGRLPLEKRGALVSLSVQDHYVEVVTTKGRELLLMRLSDAMRETGDVAGLQVHRSHWVATGAVSGAVRRGDGARLTTTAGDDIPVSRRYVPAIRAAGLLPAREGTGG
jgi:hypothetical protein